MQRDPQVKERLSPLMIAPLLNQKIVADHLLNTLSDREEVEMLESMIKRYLASREGDFVRCNEGENLFKF